MCDTLPEGPQHHQSCLLMQDTAAQVAAMTAELNQLADEMLPEASGGDEQQTQRGKETKSLQQRLVDSWDGKVSS